MDKKRDAVILDVDGTIWDSTGVVAKAWTKELQGLPGYENEVITPDDLKGLFGKTMEVIAEEILPKEDKKTQLVWMDACCRAEEEALAKNETDLAYPGAAETIHELCKRLPVCVVSNCQEGYIELMLEKTGTGDAVSDFESYGNTKMGKAENIRLLCERNHFRSPVYVGDTAGDLSECRAAGVDFIHAAYGFGTIPEEENVPRIQSIKELLEIISWK